MKFLVPILVAISIMTSVSSVTLPQASGSMMGKWSFYGTLSPKTDYRAKDFDRADIDTLQEILQYTDCIPGYEVTLTPAGVAEYLGNEHYKLESWEKLSDNEYREPWMPDAKGVTGRLSPWKVLCSVPAWLYVIETTGSSSLPSFTISFFQFLCIMNPYLAREPKCSSILSSFRELNSHRYRGIW